MRARRQSWAVSRAAIALAVLYALVLQGVLGGLTVASTLDPAHIICVADNVTGGDPSEPHPSHGHLPCCTVAHAADIANPLLPAPVAVVWPERHLVTVAWRPEVVAAPRAPPGVSASARAPPVV